METQIMERAVNTVTIDNDSVRVTEWRFAPGAATGQHRHQRDYVVVPMTTGKLRLVSADGEVLNDLTRGVPYFRRAGAEHNVFNANDFEFVFIEIELP